MGSIPDNRKKRGRGRPRTGIGSPVGLRLYPDLERRLDEWAKQQTDKPGRPEAIRRLVEKALAGKAAPRPANKEGARKAAGMAVGAIERLADKSVPVEEQERRKRRLVQGPKEFRDVRGRTPKAKNK
jgi:hypothetical protein